MFDGSRELVRGLARMTHPNVITDTQSVINKSKFIRFDDLILSCTKI